jgi:hypothetical protein
MLPEKVIKYKFNELGWFDALEALKIANKYTFLNYSIYFGLKKPSRGVLPHELEGLIYTGKSAGRKNGNKFRVDDKAGTRMKGKLKTSGYDRMSSHNRNMTQKDLAKIKEAKYRWFWHQRQLHPDWQRWYHLYAPPIEDLTHNFNIKIAVSSIEIDILEMYCESFGDATPMNREHRSDVSHEQDDSFSTKYLSTSRTLEQAANASA